MAHCVGKYEKNIREGIAARLWPGHQCLPHFLLCEMLAQSDLQGAETFPEHMRITKHPLALADPG